MMDLDEMLRAVGQFGKFQALYFSLLLFPVTLWGFRATEYIFTTMDVRHRCRVPECEGTEGPVTLEPDWLKNAVPPAGYLEHYPHPCQRYASRYNISRDNTTLCSADMFDPSKIITCSDWVFEEEVNTIGRDFGIMCPEDYWKRTLLSSLSVMTSLMGFPLAGLMSDRYGRKTVLVTGAVTIAVTGILRSFSPNYVISVGIEMFDGLVTGTIFGPAFLLGLETLSPSKRLIGSCLINTFYTVGEVVLALLMWSVADWRLLLRFFYFPMLGVVSLYWLLPESVRWLHTKRRVDEVEGVFRKIAHYNKTEGSLPNVITNLRLPSSKDKENADNGNTEETRNGLRLTQVFNSRILVIRFGVCSICWVATIFTYYGISQRAASVSSNPYLSFLSVSLIEVPAYLASLWLPGWSFLGRRGSLMAGFFLGGISSLAIAYWTPDDDLLKHSLFLATKFCATFSVCVIYIYTAEVFPTELRHTLLSACSMVGRLGSILSQQTPLIAEVVNPMTLFGCAALLGCAMTFYCPETLGTTLPDTIEEAEKIGRDTRKK